MHTMLRPVCASIVSLALSHALFAQGANDCAAPTPISGVTAFAFDNTTATTGSQGQGYLTCTDTASLTGITNDVWFVWTAPSTDHFSITTCGGTTIDSKLAVYAVSGCPTGEPLACNDDTCFQQSRVAFDATSGSSYTIQLGNWPSGLPGTGTFTIAVDSQTPCSSATGPDVIVGEIQEVENEAASGALDAISLGTTSCNVGTVWLNWMASTNQHPAIGGTLYRYSTVAGAGRFEQIGMSWLKHGFFALSNTLCCTNCQGTDGTHLGVNCADPYTASRNGTQFNLGPRWQVNAHTGAFTYPPANPTWSGTTARRCEYRSSDVSIGNGERYFGECQYVTPDDAAAGNQDNNASYRELSASGGPTDWNFAFTGGTQRAQSAIRAWPVVDPLVTLNDVHVPGDGLFVVGYKTTNLGGGQYHYEYAVYNMNGDRGAGLFSVPVPGGVAITNVGFHDVDYRNGDGEGSANRSGTDWVATVGAGAVSWSTETEASNVNANAIRWGTTYNFRFDANAAPGVVSATIGLWRAGSPSSIGTNVEGPGGITSSFAYCAGDSSGTACPCGNLSPLGANLGCANSIGSGAGLAATGTASIIADTFVLHGSGMPDSAVLYFQGTTQVASGAGATFGDGLRCAGGTTTRFGLHVNVGGVSQYPSGSDPAVHVKGFDHAGDVRTYQCWYRNSAAFCTTSTFNLTNGWQATWTP